MSGKRKPERVGYPPIAREFRRKPTQARYTWPSERVCFSKARCRETHCSIPVSALGGRFVLESTRDVIWSCIIQDLLTNKYILCLCSLPCQNRSFCFLCIQQGDFHCFSYGSKRPSCSFSGFFYKANLPNEEYMTQLSKLSLDKAAANARVPG